MARNSGIEWLAEIGPAGEILSKGDTWNVIKGCWPESPGCAHCYAIPQACRQGGEGMAYEGLASWKETATGGHVARWTGEVSYSQRHQFDPLGTRSQGRVFVNSMGDLWYERVPWNWVDRAFAIMSLCHWKTFLPLTKRAGGLHAWATDPGTPHRIRRERQQVLHEYDPDGNRLKGPWAPRGFQWPLPNVEIGVSAELNSYLESRVVLLRDIPAARIWVSCEPLLGALPSLPEYLDGSRGTRPLDWVVVGGESGPHARPCSLNAVRRVVSDCRRWGVPVFFKQWGSTLPGERVGDRVCFQNGKTDLDYLGQTIHWNEDGTAWIHAENKHEAGALLDGRYYREYPRPELAAAA